MWILYKLCICKLSYDKWSFKHAYSFHKTKRWLFKFHSTLFHFRVHWNANIVSSTFPHQYLRRGTKLWKFSSIDQMLFTLCIYEELQPVLCDLKQNQSRMRHSSGHFFFYKPLYKKLLIQQLCFITMVRLRNIHKKFSTFHMAIVMNMFNSKINKQLFEHCWHHLNLLGRTLQPLY